MYYLRGLNQWLEQDANERRAHLEQTQNKVIPSLNRIVQDMDLRREGKCYSHSAGWFFTLIVHIHRWTS